MGQRTVSLRLLPLLVLAAPTWACEIDHGGVEASGGTTLASGGSGGTIATSGGGAATLGPPASGGSAHWAPSGGAPSGGAEGHSGGVTAVEGGSGGLESGGAPASGGAPSGLSWPIDCIPGSTCVNLGYPDIDDDGVSFDCGSPGYQGHEGTDIGITQKQMDQGVAVRAAADGTVFFASDGKYDHCPSESEPDCQNPEGFVAGSTEGTTVCTELGPYCHPPGGSCFWCFAGGNVIVVLHETVEGVFATRYDHLRKGSVLVQAGDTVSRGQQIAEVGSAGNSTGPHLHFEVWADGYYDLVDPWQGTCGPNTTRSLWAAEPPWEG